MYMRWAHLLFLHWVVPADTLRAHLPPGLELDTYKGRAFVGLVPFTMTGVRPRCSPAIPGLSNFHEVNVRTYVHAGGRDPGVWFFSLDAASRIAVRLARWSYHLPYQFAQMSLILDRGAKAGGERGSPMPEIVYQSDRIGPRPASCAMRYSPIGPVLPAALGTLEHFLVERYVLYAFARGVLYRGRVHHRPYPLQHAEVPMLREDLVQAAGVTPPLGPPLAHYAREVRVEVFPLEKVAMPIDSMRPA
jgi:uncharacterized protein YqjF (DUF2071 family)